MKELIRRILFPLIPAEMYAASGTLKFRFLSWLYGTEEMTLAFDVWLPEDDGAGGE